MPRAGEVSLAHNGVLFLDEFPEFPRNILELLRQPLEDGDITVVRGAVSLTFPSSFMLVAAMSPCPCGYFGDPNRECRCTPPMIQRYVGKVSGPLLDRIDIHVETVPAKYRELRQSGPSESSDEIRARVEGARAIQLRRGFSNAVEDDPRLLPTRRGRREDARNGGSAFGAIRPGPRPHFEGFTHDRRPGRTRPNHSPRVG